MPSERPATLRPRTPNARARLTSPPLCWTNRPLDHGFTGRSGAKPDIHRQIRSLARHSPAEWKRSSLPQPSAPGRAWGGIGDVRECDVFGAYVVQKPRPGTTTSHSRTHTSTMSHSRTDAPRTSHSGTDAQLHSRADQAPSAGTRASQHVGIGSLPVIRLEPRFNRERGRLRLHITDKAFALRHPSHRPVTCNATRTATDQIHSWAAFPPPTNPTMMPEQQLSEVSVEIHRPHAATVKLCPLRSWI